MSWILTTEGQQTTTILMRIFWLSEAMWSEDTEHRRNDGNILVMFTLAMWDTVPWGRASDEGLLPTGHMCGGSVVVGEYCFREELLLQH